MCVGAKLSICKCSTCVFFRRTEWAWGGSIHARPPWRPVISPFNAHEHLWKLPSSTVINGGSDIWTWLRGDGGGEAGSVIVCRLTVCGVTCREAAMDLLNGVCNEVISVASVVFSPFIWMFFKESVRLSQCHSTTNVSHMFLLIINLLYKSRTVNTWPCRSFTPVGCLSSACISSFTFKVAGKAIIYKIVNICCRWSKGVQCRSTQAAAESL